MSFFNLHFSVNDGYFIKYKEQIRRKLVKFISKMDFSYLSTLYNSEKNFQIVFYFLISVYYIII